jgi:hypothetical protein
MDDRLTDETFRWVTPGLSADERSALEAQNLASLRRKVTYALERPDERVQFQRVEGWTTGRIIGFMHGAGLPIDRIRAAMESA